MARKVMLFLSVVTITTTVFAASALARGFVPLEPGSSRVDPSLFQNMPEESAGVAEEAAEEVAEEVTEEVGGVQVSNVAVRRPMLPKDFGPRIDEKTLKAMFEAMEWMTTHCGEECEREDSDNLGSVLEIWPGIDCRLSSGDGYEINDNAGISMGGAKAFSVTDLGDAKKMTLICPLRKESMGKITSITVSGKLDNARYSSGSAINLKNPKMPVKEAEESLKVYLHNGTKKEVLSVDGKGDFFKSSSFEENMLSGAPLFLSITSTAAHIDSIMVTYTP